jgi:hypothetical protein
VSTTPVPVSASPSGLTPASPVVPLSDDRAKQEQEILNQIKQKETQLADIVKKMKATSNPALQVKCDSIPSFFSFWFSFSD